VAGLGDLLTPIGVRAEFEKLPMPEKRRVLRQIISRVEVAPGRGHVGERIAVWFTDGTQYGEWQPEQVPPIVLVQGQAA